MSPAAAATEAHDDGAVVSDTPEDIAVEPTSSEISLIPADVGASYTSRAPVSEFEGDKQQESLADDATSEDKATAGVARVDLHSDVAVFGVSWEAQDDAPARIEYRELADGQWTGWRDIEVPTSPSAPDDDSTPRSTDPTFTANTDAIEVIAFTSENALVSELEIKVVDPRGQDPVENGIGSSPTPKDDFVPQPPGSADISGPESPSPQQEDSDVQGEEPTGSNSPLIKQEQTQSVDPMGLTPSSTPIHNAHGVVRTAQSTRLAAPGISLANVNTGLGLTIKSRSAWSATWRAVDSRKVKYRGAVVHHTAGSNSYTCSQVPGILRGIQNYHIGQKFGDMGYHFLVDKCGGVWEGRAGSLTSNPIGAQAIGANWQTFGISVLGLFQTSAPSAAAQDSLAKATAWMFKKHGVTNPKGTIRIDHQDKKGRTVPTILGHRQATATLCPGDAFFNRLPAIRDKVVRYLKGPSVRPGKLVPPFVDVYDQDKFATEIKWMSDSGITTGIKSFWGLEYRPYDRVTREAMAAFLYRAENASYSPPSVSPFADMKPGDKFYREITWMHKEGLSTGISQGKGKKPIYAPKDRVSREAMAAFLYRMDEANYNAPSTSPFTDMRRGDKFYREITWMHKERISTGISQGKGKKPKYAPKDRVSREAMAAFIYRYSN